MNMEEWTTESQEVANDRIENIYYGDMYMLNIMM